MSSKCKVVNVVLNSNQAVSGNTQSATYYMDWGAILKDNTPYYLHFTYIGGANTITGTKLATVYADFITSNKLNNSTQNGASSTQMLGFLKVQQFAPNNNSNYLSAEDNTNVPTYLAQRPNNNQFTISIYDNASPPVLFKDNAATPANPAPYLIILSFREVTKDD
jgi:hypothetical protein